MKKILAVSGGVDSVVLLHMFRNDPDVVVAHFNHGTRASADEDEKFVQALAKKYDKPFFVGHARLGEDASEETARISRYEYFAQLSKDLNGEIYTAHHADDLIETIAINLIRGTGWRGLAPFGNTKIRRPFIETGRFRSDIYRYASENSLSFRLDPTNSDEKYLRNRVRKNLQNLEKSTKLEILELYHKVNNLKHEIDATTAKIPKNTRNLYADLDDDIAIELLRALLLENSISATRPQLADFLNAIRTYPAGRKFNLPKDRFAKIGTHSFEILPDNNP